MWKLRLPNPLVQRLASALLPTFLTRNAGRTTLHATLAGTHARRHTCVRTHTRRRRNRRRVQAVRPRMDSHEAI